MHLQSSVYSHSDVRSSQSKARRFALKFAIAGAAVAVAVFGVAIPAKHLTPAPGTEAGSLVRVASVSHPAVEEPSMAPTEQPRPSTQAEVAQDPRECEPAKGITSACIFE